MDGHDSAPCSPNRSVLLERCVDVKVSRKPSPDKAWTPEQYFRPSRTIDHRRPCVTPFGTWFSWRFAPNLRRTVVRQSPRP